MYPIGNFVQTTMTERGLSRGALASALGYRNVAKALRNLDTLKGSGRITPDFQARLIAALEVDPMLFEAAVQATRDIQRDEERQRREAELAQLRAAFRPHLRVIPERSTPQPIFVAAVTGVDYWLVRPLPADILTMPVVHRLQVVGWIAREHYAERMGDVGPFGKILGYLFRTEFEKALEFDTDGMPHGELEGPVPEGKATLWISGRQLKLAETIAQSNGSR